MVELREGFSANNADSWLKQTHPQEDSDSVLPFPRSLPRPHFEHNATNAPDIYLRIVPLFIVDDLRSHPKHAPLHGSMGTHHVYIVRLLRDSETRNLTEPKLLDENVIRFQILEITPGQRSNWEKWGKPYSMNDSLGVEVVKTVEDLRSEELGNLLIESAPFPQDTVNRTARDIFKEARKPLSAVWQW